MLIADQIENVSESRQVERLVTGQVTSDGAGVKLTRVLGQDLQRRLDPFLMLDAFGSDEADDYIAGFPNHPHRGFETITYMIAGKMLHRDNAGNEGLLANGDVQWMTAGSGLIHSEIPQQESGLMQGFQLWLNLPAQDKMSAPWYQDLRSSDLPQFQTPAGAQIKLISGRSHGYHGPVSREATDPFYLDVLLEAGRPFSQTLPAGHNAFLYVYEGQVALGAKTVDAGQMAILNNGPALDGVKLEAQEPSRFLLIAGRPLNEPIAQHGPFVMNSQQEIIQAFQDFREGKFGPEVS